MLTQRQMLILQQIIQHYTRTREPVGSKTLMKQSELSCSSATIRNEMMKLEELGLIEKNHSSSGRIPSELGYRYYLDNILNAKELYQLSPQTREQIRMQVENPLMQIKDMFQLSADILSQLTNYTCISLGPELMSSKLTGFRLVSLGSQQVMAILVTNNGYVENKVFTIPEQLDEEKLEHIVTMLSKELVGLHLVEVLHKLEHDIPALMQEYLQSAVQLIAAIYQMVSRFEQDRIHVAGKKHLLNLVNELPTLEHLKGVYQLMDEPSNLYQLVQQDTADIQVRLGHELGNPYLKDFSLISATYDLPSHEKGFIALLGPVDMPYEQVISLVNGLRSELTLSLNDFYEQEQE